MVLVKGTSTKVTPSWPAQKASVVPPAGAKTYTVPQPAKASASMAQSFGSLICWIFQTNLVMVLIGQFIKNIGGLPCAYVFMALFADCLDHLEWKTDLRIDGAAMSIYNIIAVALVGIMTGVFNWMLSRAGYLAPFTANSVSDAAGTLTANGWTPQIALETIKPAADGVLTVALQQLSSVNWVISFAFVGLEVFTGIALVVILFFLNVEKDLPKKQAEIKARHEKENQQ